jgi:hypothetical protein
VYETGLKLSSKAMEEIEKQINRLPELPKWFVEIEVLLRNNRIIIYLEFTN